MSQASIYNERNTKQRSAPFGGSFFDPESVDVSENVSPGRVRRAPAKLRKSCIRGPAHELCTNTRGNQKKIQKIQRKPLRISLGCCETVHLETSMMYSIHLRSLGLRTRNGTQHAFFHAKPDKTLQSSPIFHKLPGLSHYHQPLQERNLSQEFTTLCGFS